MPSPKYIIKIHFCSLLVWAYSCVNGIFFFLKNPTFVACIAIWSQSMSLGRSSDYLFILRLTFLASGLVDLGTNLRRSTD